MVDTISGLASADYRHDEWGVDVTISGSQKGLMLPPGISFNAVSDKARAVAAKATLPKSFWGWEEMIANNKNGFFPYTPATNLLYGLAEAIDMLHEEGLDNVFARHTASRRGDAARRPRLGPRDPVPGPIDLFAGAHRRRHAGRAQRGSPSAMSS